MMLVLTFIIPLSVLTLCLLAIMAAIFKEHEKEQKGAEMNYQFFIDCEQRHVNGQHSLEMDDAVITNWYAAMWEEECHPMVLALPQMQSAILEWRAHWLGPETSFEKVQDLFQDIHDFWVANLEGRPTSFTGERLPGDWLKFHPVRPGSRLAGKSPSDLLSGLFSHTSGR